jgi:hypothetical protein
MNFLLRHGKLLACISTLALILNLGCLLSGAIMVADRLAMKLQAERDTRAAHGLLVRAQADRARAQALLMGVESQVCTDRDDGGLDAGQVSGL